jgi:hypothetical protein
VRELSALARRPLLLGIVVGVVSILLVATGIMGVVSDTRELGQLRELASGEGVRADATVTEAVDMRGNKLASRRFGNRTPEYCPRYGFAVDGVEYSVLDHSDCGDSPSDVTLGAVASVVYDPSDPTIAFLDTDRTAPDIRRDRLISIAFVVAGVGGVVASPLLVVRARRRVQERTDARRRVQERTDAR